MPPQVTNRPHAYYSDSKNYTPNEIAKKKQLSYPGGPTV